MKTTLKIFLLLLAAFILTSCAPASVTGSKVEGALQSSVSDTGKCLRDSDETRLLVNIAQNYCVQYPAGYDIAYPNESEIMLIQRSMLNVEDPSAHIQVLPAEGMTVEQAADKLVADYAVPGMEVKRTSLTVGDEQAIMLDGLTGQDVNRQLVVIHNDRLYHLVFMPMDESQAEVYLQAQTLYDTVVRSFNFRPDTNLCADCP